MGIIKSAGVPVVALPVDVIYTMKNVPQNSLILKFVG